MPRIDLSSEDNLFPEFFQASQSGDVNQLLHREPDWLVDLFYLRASETAPIILAALLGCSDGHLLLVIGDGMDKLSPLLRSKISDFQVSHRRKLRAIVGQEITIYTLYGVEQNVHTDGFNDALYLHARLDLTLRRVG